MRTTEGPTERERGPRPGGRGILATSEGSRAEEFGVVEWGLLAAIASIWGSSFLWMEVGLEDLSPSLITLLRVGLGTAALALVPRARRRLDREDLPRVALLGVVWIAVPLSLFPLAQQYVSSAVAGMMNGAMPLFSALLATLLLRRLPGARQIWGLVVGFGGVVLITLPSLRGADAAPLGVGLLVLAVACYGLATNLAVPLQQRYGSLPVILRAQLVSLVLVAPQGLVGAARSTFAWDSMLAMIPLGVLSTGLAFVLMVTLVGRAGASRGSIAIYFVPIVAILLGVVVLAETVHVLALVGTGLVIVGAALTSRRDVRRAVRGMTT